MFDDLMTTTALHTGPSMPLTRLEIDLNTADDIPAIVAEIIALELPGTLPEVHTAVAWYANKNFGAARLLALRCEDALTQQDVETVVGWPMSGERQETGVDLYLRFKAENYQQSAKGTPHDGE